MSITAQIFAQNLPVINQSKKTFSLYMGDDDTPLIFGYENAATSSVKMICFSSFTADVENNPHGCFLGSYYTTEDITIQYISTVGEFVKLQFNGDNYFYIEKKFVKFE